MNETNIEQAKVGAEAPPEKLSEGVANWVLEDVAGGGAEKPGDDQDLRNYTKSLAAQAVNLAQQEGGVRHWQAALAGFLVVGALCGASYLLSEKVGSLPFVREVVIRIDRDLATSPGKAGEELEREKAIARYLNKIKEGDIPVDTVLLHPRNSMDAMILRVIAGERWMFDPEDEELQDQLGPVLARLAKEEAEKVEEELDEEEEGEERLNEEELRELYQNPAAAVEFWRRAHKAGRIDDETWGWYELAPEEAEAEVREAFPESLP